MGHALVRPRGDHLCQEVRICVRVISNLPPSGMGAFGFAALQNCILIKFGDVLCRILDIAIILRSSFLNRTVVFGVGLMIRDAGGRYGQVSGRWEKLGIVSSCMGTFAATPHSTLIKPSSFSRYSRVRAFLTERSNTDWD